MASGVETCDECGEVKPSSFSGTFLQWTVLHRQEHCKMLHKCQACHESKSDNFYGTARQWKTKHEQEACKILHKCDSCGEQKDNWFYGNARRWKMHHQQETCKVLHKCDACNAMKDDRFYGTARQWKTKHQHELCKVMQACEACGEQVSSAFYGTARQWKVKHQQNGCAVLHEVKRAARDKTNSGNLHSTQTARKSSQEEDYQGEHLSILNTLHSSADADSFLEHKSSEEPPSLGASAEGGLEPVGFRVTPCEVSKEVCTKPGSYFALCELCTSFAPRINCQNCRPLDDNVEERR
eukprot:TRINITY_DN66094_c0_g1_i1.p1 TRINITY_DN66094_c0_g1~~TRINITY_DN66094_c0_g1_i1.p1  ORF type:complete len:315 (-),score=41.95 TRINITY_DN66094_c0_g1_i1:90-974(-)